MKRAARRYTLIAVVVPLLSVSACSPQTEPTEPTEAAESAAPRADAAELAQLRSLALSSLGPPPAQPSNSVADDPRAAELGYRVFFDPDLSSTGEVSCAHCHVPGLYFSDGLARSRGVGQTARNAPTVVGSAYAPWLFHDGRRDSLWSQALAPFESADEMALTRLEVARRVALGTATASLYAELFGPPARAVRSPTYEPAGPFGEPAARDNWHRLAANERRDIDTAFANVGKSLEAYQRTLLPAAGRFDRYAEAVLSGRTPNAASRLTPTELEGMRLFMDVGRTRCMQCHNGALMTNQSFHDVGTARDATGRMDFGRFLGIQSLLLDPFNCLGPHSDAKPEECRELRFLDKRTVSHETGKFKTPTLRGLTRTGPYMHDGRFETLAEVIEHYRRPPETEGGELIPIELNDAEAAALAAFLRTLGDEVDAAPSRLAPPAL